MPLYNNVIRKIEEEEENPGAAFERAKDIGKSAIKFLGPDPDSPTFVQELGAEFLEMAAHKNPYTYIGAQIAQNIPAIKTGKEVLEKSYKSVLDTAFSPLKRASQTWDDFTYMIGGGVGTGTGVGPDDVKPVRITNRDIPGPVTNPNTPIESWLGNNPLTGEGKIQLAESVYLDSIKGSNRTQKITNYKLRGDESFQKWAREEYVPLMDAAAKEAGMGPEPFYSVIASKPGFKYIEHRIAKRADLRWYWEMTGDPNIPWDVKANDVSNLRLLLDDRFKKLKDVVEVQIYGDSKGLGGINNTIPNNADKYIVDIQSPNTGNKFIGLNQNAGDIVIKKAGTGEEVGRIGEYYNVLFSSQEDLMQRLPLKFPELKNMTSNQRDKWIRKWRKGILQDHLDIIKNKEKSLVGLTDTEKSFKINQALIDDMVDFRQEYEGILPFLTKGEWSLYRKGMEYEEIKKLQMMKTPPPPDGLSLLNQSIQSGKSQASKLRPLFKDYTKTLERETTKLKGTGYSSILDEILRIKKDDK